MTETKQKDETEFAALAGIDLTDQKHVWALQVPGDINVERGELDHKSEAVDVWATELAALRRSAYRRVVEQARGSLLFMLTKYSH